MQHKADSIEHIRTKLPTITGKLMNERWHVFINGSFEFGVLVVFVHFFAKSTDATLKRLPDHQHLQL